ncbi:hypothetical protein ABP2_3919 [Bacillus subtilis subsp. subtilis]|nr:hypothetical protein [Bacillus subtilis subsp. subtilis]
MIHLPSGVPEGFFILGKRIADYDLEKGLKPAVYRMIGMKWPRQKYCLCLLIVYSYLLVTLFPS